jgi:hypothetical protein
MEDSIEYFSDRKKIKLHEIKVEKMKQTRQAKQVQWAARLVPLDKHTKHCCSKRCINGCILLPMLLKTRKFIFTLLNGISKFEAQL